MQHHLCVHALTYTKRVAPYQTLPAARTQVDSALSAASSLLYPKGLDGAVVASRARHAETVEAAHEAREAYLKKARSAPTPLLVLQAVVSLVAACNEVWKMSTVLAWLGCRGKSAQPRVTLPRPSAAARWVMPFVAVISSSTGLCNAHAVDATCL
jgi:hypothetical protein